MMLNHGDDFFSVTVMVGTCLVNRSNILFLNSSQFASTERFERSIGKKAANCSSSEFIAE